VSESIRAVERALDVLLCFSKKTPELSMTQIAEKVGINKSTVHRLLATLEAKRFVERDPVTGTYRAGIHLLQMAYLTMESNDVSRVAEPFLQRLSEMHRETIDLAVFDGNDVVFTKVIESPQRVKLAAAIGQRLPAFCTASGKAILAFLPLTTVEHILEHGMPKYSQFTPTSPAEYYKDLQQTREAGFSISDQEYEEGISAVSAPIFGKNGLPIAAVAVAGPAYRLSREKMVEIGPSVRDIALEISREIEMSQSK
jgi:IclR family acetate operon transcriptional repressor